MSWTVLVKSPVISQWADFSVTAPSGLVPWPAFYDGTEIVTVIWWWSLPSSLEFNTKVVVAKWVAPDDIWFIHWLYQDSNYIYLLWWSLIKDWSLLTKNLCVTRYNKVSYSIDRYEHSIWPIWSDTIASWIWIWIDWTEIHFLSSNVTWVYSWSSFDTTTLSYTDYWTIWSTFPWSYISWTWTRTNSPWNTHFENWYYSNTIIYWSYTIQWIFRFRYWVASWATTKYVAWEWYVSSIITKSLSPSIWTDFYAIISNMFNNQWNYSSVLPTWFATELIWWKRYYMWTFAFWQDSWARTVDCVTVVAIEDWSWITSHLCSRWWVTTPTAWWWTITPEFYLDWTDIHCQVRNDFNAGTSTTHRYITFDTITETFVNISWSINESNNVWVNISDLIDVVTSVNNIPSWSIISNSLIDWWYTYSTNIIWYSYVTQPWSSPVWRALWWIFVALRS